MPAIADIPVLMSQETKPVRINPAIAKKLRLIVEWMNDTDHFHTNEVVSMGDLLAKWAEPHIKQYIKQAVTHSEKKNKELLD